MNNKVGHEILEGTKNGHFIFFYNDADWTKKPGMKKSYVVSFERETYHGSQS